MTKIRTKKAISFPAAVLSPLRNFLLSKQNKLERRRRSLANEDPFADVDRLTDNAASDADAKEQLGHDRVAALRYEVDKGLINIRKALTKIKFGKYGLCENCSKMIDTDRLAIDPTVGFCVACSKRQTKK